MSASRQHYLDWLRILAVQVGLHARYVDRPSPSPSYLAEASYPVYILHQTVIVLVGYLVARVLPEPWFGWTLLISCSVALTYGVYEGVRRSNVLRFLFGTKAIAKAIPAAEGARA